MLGFHLKAIRPTAKYYPFTYDLASGQILISYDLQDPQQLILMHKLIKHCILSLGQSSKIVDISP